MDLIRSVFSKRQRPAECVDSIPSYDVPFARPSVHRIIIPPKPSNLVGKSIAPRSTRQHEPVATPAQEVMSSSSDQSVVLFGSPLPTAKTVDTVSTGVRYPTNVLFLSPWK
jgi:hypothetical protein